MNPIVMLLGSFVVLCIIGLPIAVSLLLSAFASAVVLDIPPIVMIQQMYAMLDSYSLLAVPLFLLVGSIMESGGITEKLVTFSKTLVGHIHGGLGHVNVVSNMVMAGISGSAVADAAALGSVMIPAMKKEGYPPEMAAAINATASTMGPIIPPSIMMLVYGAYGNVSIAAMFLGGVVPGVIVGGALMVFIYVWAYKNNFPKSDRRSTLGEIWTSFKGSFLALLAPVFIIIGVVGGIYTATEGGMVAAVYSLIITVFVYKTQSLKNVFNILKSVLVGTTQPLLCVAGAGAFGYMMAYLKIPAMILEMIQPFANTQLSVMLFIVVLYIILGTFMDGAPAIVIFISIVQGLAASVGLNQVHVGVLVIVTLCFGFITPPYGLTLLLSSGLAGVPPSNVIRSLVPIYLVLLAVLVILVLFPDLVLFLPRLFVPASVN